MSDHRHHGGCNCEAASATDVDNELDLAAAYDAVHAHIDTHASICFNEHAKGAGVRVFKAWQQRHDR